MSVGFGPQGGQEAPAVRLVREIVSDAVRLRASDIHVEPRKENVEVRMRIDGVLQVWREFPRDLQDSVASRIKVLAELDINEKRLPQDGRIAFSVSGKSFDVRVSTLPVLYGEKVVLRLLDRSMSVRALDELDFTRHNAAAFHDLVHQPLGLVLVTGPTGSGKTTTLYAALNVLRSKRVNIMTCEDPVEIDLDGVNQSAVNEKVGLTFGRQLRAILRQDPDIVLVGEMRDTETAEIAFRAAMTGHLVLSTLHSNDAPTSVTRLIDMGVPPFLISSGLIGMVAQRLVRRLCPKCRRPGNPTEYQAQLLSVSMDDRFWHDGGGCQHCEETGFVGRIGVHEVVRVDETFQRLVMTQASAPDLRQAAVRAGMVPIREDALIKIRAGMTSPEEVLRQVYVKLDDYDEVGGSVSPAALPAAGNLGTV